MLDGFVKFVVRPNNSFLAIVIGTRRSSAREEEYSAKRCRREKCAKP
jgi:hypothetical protein